VDNKYIKRWKNGTTTVIEVVEDKILVTDEGPYMEGGTREVEQDIDATLDLADEHDELNRLLRRAARRAQDNRNGRIVA
jgi:hypothetical protein